MVHVYLVIQVCDCELFTWKRIYAGYLFFALCLFSFNFLFSMLLVFLDCPFVNVPSVFSNVYLLVTVDIFLKLIRNSLNIELKQFKFWIETVYILNWNSLYFELKQFKFWIETVEILNWNSLKVKIIKVQLHFYFRYP